MQNTSTVDQLQYLFTFPFNDPNWKQKIGIGFLLSIGGFVIPVIPWVFLTGYFVSIFRAGVEAEEPLTLPEWDDWGLLFKQGLRVIIVKFIAYLPIVLLFFTGYFAMFIPALLVPMSAASGADPLPAAILAPMVGTFGGMALFGLSITLFLLLTIVLPAAVGHTIVNEQVGAAFRVREWWPIFQANLGGYLLTTILVLGTVMFISYSMQLLYMTIVLCCFVPILTGFMYFYVGIISNVTFGQAYRIGRDALPFKPDNLTPGNNQDNSSTE